VASIKKMNPYAMYIIEDKMQYHWNEDKEDDINIYGRNKKPWNDEEHGWTLPSVSCSEISKQGSMTLSGGVHNYRL